MIGNLADVNVVRNLLLLDSESSTIGKVANADDENRELI